MAVKKLIENIIRGKPIPAIFLYREASGDQYEYNILDGKNRLESLILFIGNERPNLKIADVNRFFFDRSLRDYANFSVQFDGESLSLKEMDEGVVRDFRDYVIPTIEITLSEDDPGQY